MKLYYHPASAYSQKVLIALEEKQISFEGEIVDLFDPAKAAEYKKTINPMGKIPMLVLADGWRIPESSIIVEYLDTHFDSGTRLIPADKDEARRVRFFDRMADLYVQDPTGTIFFDGLKPEAQREPARVAKAKETLAISYERLNAHFSQSSGPWMLGNQFTMGDCAAAPALTYARFVMPMGEFKHLDAYWNRVAERPSVAKVAAAAQPYLAAFMK